MRGAAVLPERLHRRTGIRVWADARTAQLPLWPMLTVVSAVVMLVQLPGAHATAWHFFHDSARLLVGDAPPGETGGLHLYGAHPEFQFGPLSIGFAVPFSLLGHTAGSWAAMAMASVAGLIAFALLLDTVERLQPGFRDHVGPSVLLASGIAVIITWGDVAVRTAHIDDAIALVSVVAAMRWCSANRRWLPPLALALAAAAKPWAIMLAPLALLPVSRSPSPMEWLRTNSAGIARVGLIGALALLSWAPFVLAEPQTLDTADFGINNDATSALRALGVSDPTTPSWVRPAQLVGGMAVVGLVVMRGWWPSALLAGMAWRLLLDPGAHRYYTIGLVLGALIVELAVRWNRIPWATIAVAVTLEITALPAIPELPGRTLRLICVILALAAVALPSVRRGPDASDAVDPDDRPPRSRTPREPATRPTLSTRT